MDAAAKFTAGYLFGITYKDEKDYILSCFKNDADLNNIIDAAMADEKKGDYEASQKEWEKTQKLFETDMGDCKDVAKDFEALKKFEEDVLARPDAKEYIQSRMEKYKTELEDNSKNKVAVWGHGAYFTAGQLSGYSMMYLGLAPPHPKGPTAESTSDRDPTAPAQWIAGWYYGVEGEDKRDYILGCYKADDDLTITLYDAMEAYIGGDEATGEQKMKDARPMYQIALQACDEVNGKMKEIGDKIYALPDTPDWDKISKEIYNDNKARVDRDVDLMLREWKQGVFFNSGMFTGYVDKIFLDNAPPAPKTAYAHFAPF